MLLPWLVDNFKIFPVYLVRHPLSVISSQFNHPAFNEVTWDSLFNRQHSRYKDIFTKYEHFISSIGSREELFANWWAINNVVALFHPYNNKKWLTLSYESLLLRPDFEINRISKRSNIQFSSEISTKLQKPSATTHQESPIMTGENQLLSWQKTLSPNQVETILKVVRNYGIDAYNESEEPDYGKLGYEIY